MYQQTSALPSGLASASALGSALGSASGLAETRTNMDNRTCRQNVSLKSWHKCNILKLTVKIFLVRAIFCPQMDKPDWIFESHNPRSWLSFKKACNKNILTRARFWCYVHKQDTFLVNCLVFFYNSTNTNLLKVDIVKLNKRIEVLWSEVHPFILMIWFERKLSQVSRFF